MSYDSREQYIQDLRRRSRPPEGFRCAAVPVRFRPAEKPESPAAMNLSLILLEQATPLFAAVFTRNAFPGAPIHVNRQRLGEERIRGVLINNRVANVGAPGGVEDAVELLDALASSSSTAGASQGGATAPGTRSKSPEAPLTGRSFLAASTGVIGWKLPVAEMRAALPGLTAGLQGDSLLPLAEAIMTTDAWPKLRAREVGQGRIVGLAKGAGMIEPNLATMLVFLLTDVRMERESLRRILPACAARSFNSLSIDGDQSTSDMAVLISSGRKPPVPEEAFEEALLAVCRELAEDIVRNGEGVGHVIRLRLTADLPDELARGAGKAVLNSPLVKTAVFGNDPNVGRIVSALGDFLGNAGAALDPRTLTVRMGGIELFSGGAFRLDGDKERRLSAYLRECAIDLDDPARRGYPQHDRAVELEIRLGTGGRTWELLGSDLSYAYVRENADYRS